MSSVSRFFWFGASSVPGLVLVVPSVEIVVEEDDASRRHAGNDAPEGGLAPISIYLSEFKYQQKKSEIWIFLV